MKKVKCELCGYEIDNHQIKKHKNTCNGLGPYKIRKNNGRGKNWLKDKTLEEAFGKNKAQEIKNKLSKALTGKSTGRASTEEKEIQRKRKISFTMTKKRMGGYRKGSGRGKKGRYKGIWCDSSWELAWVIYHLEHNIKFERNWKKFEYVYENKTYSYIPDFIKDDMYIEIKGYLSEQAKQKISQFPYTLLVLQEKDIQKYIEYVIKKYGNDFIKLYD